MTPSNQETLGDRIRYFRKKAWLSQKKLAKTVEISAPYLNLIEKDKRKIGGALMVRISESLNVSMDQLSSAPDSDLVRELCKIASDHNRKTKPTPGACQQFIREHGDWADLIVFLSQKIQNQDAKIQSLSDRLANNPVLAKSMHDMLSMVTAIRSSAGILHETKDLEPQWQARFSRNIFEDSDRLVEDYKRVTELLIADESEGSA